MSTKRNLTIKELMYLLAMPEEAREAHIIQHATEWDYESISDIIREQKTVAFKSKDANLYLRLGYMQTLFENNNPELNK